MTIYVFSEKAQGEDLKSQAPPEKYYVYLLSDPSGSVLFSGVSNNLRKKVAEIKEKHALGFSREYQATYLVYFEVFKDPYSAMAREKELKAMSKFEKSVMVESLNPHWEDLYQVKLGDLT